MNDQLQPASVSVRLCSRSFAAALCMLSLGLAAPAQMHKVARPESVTRAVAVYEYIGDVQHPKAARLIPVSLFLGGHFEDAGVYLARPVPLALDPGNVYELQRSGVHTGFLDLSYARNFNSGGSQELVSSSFDNGWFGYGLFRPLPGAPKPKGGATTNRTSAYVVQDDGKPKLVSKTDAPPPALKPGEDDDPDRPAKISLPDDTGGKRGPDDPDPERPTLHRQTSAGASQPTEKDKNGKPVKPPKVVVTATGDPGDDPDRPRIRRHTEDENTVPPDPIELGSGKSTNNADIADTVTAGPGLTSGGRPVLKRGRANAVTGPELARVARTDLDQVIAVSDAVNRPEHDFRFTFASDADRAAVLSKMEALAEEVLAHPELATDAPDFVKAGATAAAAPAAAPSRTAAGARSSRARRAAAATAPTKLPLADEQLSAFQLTYSAEPTYVFTAHTAAAAGATIRYATVVAQPDLDGKLQIAMRSTTDSAHLDRVPRFRFVDAVDADASNRASLLFELGGAHTRQFALYRLLGAHSDQLFVTGSVM